jgi:hypothetical protein
VQILHRNFPHRAIAAQNSIATPLNLHILPLAQNLPIQTQCRTARRCSSDEIPLKRLKQFEHESQQKTSIEQRLQTFSGPSLLANLKRR